MTRKKRRALLCMLAVPLLALAPRSEESLPASAAEPAAVPEKYVALTFDDGPWARDHRAAARRPRGAGRQATFFLIGEQIAGMRTPCAAWRTRGIRSAAIPLRTWISAAATRRAPARDRCDDETLRALLGDGVYWLRRRWASRPADRRGRSRCRWSTGRWIRRTGAGWTPTP